MKRWWERLVGNWDLKQSFNLLYINIYYYVLKFNQRVILRLTRDNRRENRIVKYTGRFIAPCLHPDLALTSSCQPKKRAPKGPLLKILPHHHRSRVVPFEVPSSVLYHLIDRRLNAEGVDPFRAPVVK